MKEDGDKIDNIGIDIQQRCEHILALFVSAGYIIINNGAHNITPKYCKNMKHNFIYIFTLYFTSVRVQSGPRIWYIGTNIPLLMGPKQQGMTSIHRLPTHVIGLNNDDYD